MRNRALLFSLLWVVAGAPGYGQEPPSAFDFDTSNMKVTVTMDRETYLPGEIARVTLEVSNPGSTRVVSLTPFLSATGCLGFQQKVGKRPFGLVNCGTSDLDASNVTAFGPGESKKMVLNSYDSMFDIDTSAMQGDGVPSRTGTFGLIYRYGRSAAAAEYTVAAAKLQADATVRVHDVMYSDNPDLVSPKPLAQYVHVLALRSEGASYICVQQQAGDHADLIANQSDLSGGDLDFSFPRVRVGSATPLKRVATSITPVVSLAATADDQENLTIVWTDASGRQETLRYEASYPARKQKQ